MQTVLPPAHLSEPEPPRTGLGRWLARTPGSEPGAHTTFPWYRVLWLTGVDYFSTLGYQPGIALVAVGVLSPLATVALVLVTLFGALPVYMAVAGRSFEGQGSISMLERLLPGWKGKVFVLALVGFASTDFVITMTLSAADAAEHAVDNPFLFPYIADERMAVTLGLIALLAVVFLRGFREAVGVAAWLTVPYLGLNLVVIGRALLEIRADPELLVGWQEAVARGGDPSALALIALLAFPKLALGLSGFETGVTVMPLIRGEDAVPPGEPPPRRIAATRALLAASAIIMSFFLITSSFVTAVLIPEWAYQEGGAADGRALAFLAHTYLGETFGTVYDASTILILWFAGSSAMAAMLTLIPRYLPRFGMAPTWVARPRPLILLLLTVNVAVTVAFDADVDEQGGAYATGVLALILSASVAVTLAVAREAREAHRGVWRAAPFALISLVFAYTFVDNVLERPDGIIISSIFIGTIVTLSALSRYLRATEFRVEKVALATPESEVLWAELREKRVHLVAVKASETILARKKARLREFYAVDGPIAWIHVELVADRSGFDSTNVLRVARLGDDYRITVSNAAAIANTIAYLSELIQPRSIFLGLTHENPVGQAVRFLLWGEGETGILVYQILLKYWSRSEAGLAASRPHVFLMSD